MDQYIVETRTKLNPKWVQSLLADTKEYDQDEFKVFVRLYAKMFWSETTEYRILIRHEYVIGSELPSVGKWRIQTKYNDNTPESSKFLDEPGFATWGDINVMKADGYSSYDEAFNALKEFGFEKHNPSFIWRIVQD
jgi:hypothetical protein